MQERNFCSQGSVFSVIGPGRRTRLCSLYIYTSHYKVFIFIESRHRKANMHNLFRHTNYYDSLAYTNCAVRVQMLCSAFTEKRAMYSVHHKLKTLQQLKKFFSKISHTRARKADEYVVKRKEKINNNSMETYTEQQHFTFIPERQGTRLNCF